MKYRKYAKQKMWKKLQVLLYEIKEQNKRLVSNTCKEYDKSSDKFIVEKYQKPLTKRKLHKALHWLKVSFRMNDKVDMINNVEHVREITKQNPVIIYKAFREYYKANLSFERYKKFKVPYKIWNDWLGIKFSKRKL